MTQSGTVIVRCACRSRPGSGGLYTTTPLSSTDSVVTYDITSPTVTINQATQSHSARSGRRPHRLFHCRLQQAGRRFHRGLGVTITGTAGGTTATVTQQEGSTDGMTYTVAITGMTPGRHGDRLPLGPRSPHHALGNPNVASTSTDVPQQIADKIVAAAKAAGVGEEGEEE